MKKLFAAMLAAGLVVGVGSAVARDTTKHSSGNDAATQSQQDPGSPADERRNRDSTQQGETVPGPGAGKHPADSAETNGAPVTTDKTTGQSSNPGDPTDEMRNRDSSKQQDRNSPPKQ